MLLEFRVSNYRSIGEEQILSLIPATNQQEYPQNIISSNPKYQVLNAIALYGPNGGGKSNILRSMSLMDRIIHVSARAASTMRLPFDPFQLREGWMDKPTSFEISFIIEEYRYRYGFEYNEREIESEWLFRKAVGREVSLFNREKDTIDVSSGYKASKKAVDAAIETTRPNALFLSTCDALNVDEAKRIMKWFGQFSMVDGLNAEFEEIKTVDLWQRKEYREKIKTYIANLDLQVVDIDVTTKEFEESDLEEGMPPQIKSGLASLMKNGLHYSVFSRHRYYDKKGNATDRTVTWKWNERESSGAKQAFNLSGPVLWALAAGGVLIIDEIEAKLHPAMTLQTIDAFLDKESNPNGAQLLFATHDTNLLTYSRLRRDQVYFVEKNKWESTEVYSLSDFTYFHERGGKMIPAKERPDSNKEKRYIEGRYNAIPALGRFKKFIRKTQWQKEEE